MAEINLLEPSVYNRIAAGEVVERPASIVKELVENCIDAGATKIDVEITNGGIDSIIVSDNGKGINANDLKLAFLPHATSKIKSAEDLDGIATLGFRGEALSSIAAVALVKLTSKVKSSQAAAYIEIDNGEVKSQGEVGAPEGTRVEVSNLFYKIPARHKFLKKPKQEESEITTLLSRLILANPKIAFTYMVEGKRVFQSTGKSPEDAVMAVYSASTMQNIIPVFGTTAGVKLTGFVGKPSFAKPNRTYQTLVINGRYVINFSVSAAVAKAYANFLMKNQFAFYVLYLNIPHSEVDVNVHPNKLDVRFEDSQKIFGLVMHAVETALLDYSKSGIIEVEEKSIESVPTKITSNAPVLEPTEIIQVAREKEPVQRPESLSIPTQGGGHKIASPSTIIQEIVLEKKEAIAKEDATKPIEQPKETQQGSLFDKDVTLQEFKLQVRVVGKIYNTYLIIEYNDSVYIIDQHAAHERVLYDLFIAEMTAKKVSAQGLLVPFILNVNHAEAQFLSNNTTLLKELGFEVDEFGYLSFKVSTIPASLVGMDVGAFFNSVLKDLSKDLALSSTDILKDRIATSACKAAVKAGMDLEENEIIALLNQIKDKRVVLLCPHGRPIIVELSRGQMDKWFKRVL